MKKIITVIILIVLALIISGVIMFKINISVSDKRIAEVQSLQLSDTVTIQSWGAIFIDLGSSNFFPSSFCIEGEDVTVYIDPVMIDDGEVADYILITHAHADHFSLEDIDRLSDENTIIYGPKRLDRKLKGYQFIQVSPGDMIQHDAMAIQAVHAYSTGFPSHPKSAGNVGYILTLEHQRIYHTGDTHVVAEMLDVEDIDVILLPIDGGNLTMGTQDAADYVNKLSPRIAIPCHYVVGQQKAKQFADRVSDNIEVCIMAD